jgi:hypothetical protein
VTTPSYLHQLTDDLANKKETVDRQTVQMPELGYLLKPMLRT